MSEIRKKLLAAFQVEQREHLDAVRGMLRDAAGRGFDFKEAHRRVHSLKGAARIVGLDAVEALSRQLEALMALGQTGRIAADRRVADCIGLALDAIEASVAHWQGGSAPPDIEEALRRISVLSRESDAR